MSSEAGISFTVRPSTRLDRLRQIYIFLRRLRRHPARLFNRLIHTAARRKLIDARCGYLAADVDI